MKIYYKLNNYEIEIKEGIKNKVLPFGILHVDDCYDCIVVNGKEENIQEKYTKKIYEKIILNIQDKKYILYPLGEVFDKDTEYNYKNFIEEKEEDKTFCVFGRKRIQESNSLDIILDIVDNSIRKIVSRHYRQHLKEEKELLSVEFVKRICPETIRHIVSHSEHWKGRTLANLIPARLLAVNIENDYAIYENVVVKNLIDKTLKYIKALKDVYLRNLFYYETLLLMTTGGRNNNVIAQAYQKLFKGFDFGDNENEKRKILRRDFKKIEKIETSLYYCKKQFLYQKLSKVEKIYSSLKKTNIFKMDKYYKNIYKLWNNLFVSKLWNELPKYNREDDTKEEYETNSDNNYYSVFCDKLISFSLEYFKQQNTNFNRYWNFKKSSEEPNYNYTLIEIEKQFKEEIIIDDRLKEKWKQNIRNNNIMETYSIIEENEMFYFINPVNREKIGDLARNIFSNVHDISNFASDNDKIANIEVRKIKILFYPINFKLLDSQKEAEECFKLLQEYVQKKYEEINFDYCYFLSSFSPIDYTNANKEYSQLLLNYIYDTDCKYGLIPITISDMNSFRRIHKILLFHMVNLEKDFKICPICSKEMIVVDKSYKCDSCGIEIIKNKCSTCGHEYPFIRTAKEKIVKFELGKAIEKGDPNININIDNKEAYDIMQEEIKYGFKNINEIGHCPKEKSHNI